MEKIKIGYFADGPWSYLAFEKLIDDDSIEIKFIVPRTDTNGQILAKTNEGFLVKTKDNFIEILEIESDHKLRVGDKLGK